MLEEAIRSQYHAALEMTGQAIEKCPPTLWNRAQDKNKFWQVAYHALFYTHLYLQPVEADFTRWSGHIPGSERMEPVSGQPLSQQAMKTYLAFCHEQVETIVPTLDFEAASGFSWLPMSKLEVQFYSLRHLQLHTGELAERLWDAAGIEVHWVGRGVFKE